jgi:hypothetical protein
LLVGAATAVPHLELVSISVYAIGHIEALGTIVKRDGAAGAKFPLLVGAARAVC